MDGWKQESHIANRVKSMPTDGGIKNMMTNGGKMSRQDQVQDQDGGCQQTIRHLGKQKDQKAQLRSSVEQKYIMHNRWGQEWLMLNYDCGAAVMALLVAVAGDLLLEKRGEFRVASGAVIPNLVKIKMKSTDESGLARSIRGHITEVGKPLLSAAEVSRRWDSLLFSSRTEETFWNEIHLLLWRSEQF